MIPNTENRVFDIVATRLRRAPTELSRETDFTRDLAIDSLDAVDVQMAVEENFDIELPDDAVESVATIGDLIQVIEAHWSGCQHDQSG